MDDGVCGPRRPTSPPGWRIGSTDSDPTWPLQRAERKALVDLNVPHFTTVADIARGAGAPRWPAATDAEIDWQIELIRQNTDLLRRASPRDADRPRLHNHRRGGGSGLRSRGGRAAGRHAVGRTRFAKGPGAAWVGLDWLGDSEVSQLVVLGPDLYNGAAVSPCSLPRTPPSRATRRRRPWRARPWPACVKICAAAIRRGWPGRSVSAAGLGLGSIVYGLAVIAGLLDDDAILADAHAAADVDHRRHRRGGPPARRARR